MNSKPSFSAVSLNENAFFFVLKYFISFFSNDMYNIALIMKTQRKCLGDEISSAASQSTNWRTLIRLCEKLFLNRQRRTTHGHPSKRNREPQNKRKGTVMTTPVQSQLPTLNDLIESKLTISSLTFLYLLGRPSNKEMPCHPFSNSCT
jgi:hypothetical protein